MNFKDLEDFIKIAKDCGASSLEYKSDGQKFSISFPTESAPVLLERPMMHSPVEDSGSKKASSPGLIEIKSPFVGTFYRSPSPSEPEYDREGDQIRPGQVLCIIEAMKIMNEIECECSGEIVEICLENETYVEFGEVLFKVRPQ